MPSVDHSSGMAIWTKDKTLGSATSSMKADACLGGASWPLFGRMTVCVKERMKSVMSLIVSLSRRSQALMSKKLEEKVVEPAISLNGIRSRRGYRLWMVAFKDDQSLKEGMCDQ